MYVIVSKRNIRNKGPPGDNRYPTEQSDFVQRVYLTPAGYREKAQHKGKAIFAGKRLLVYGN